MIALDKIERGVAYNHADCIVISGMKLYRINAATHADSTNPIRAIAMDFKIGINFSLLSSSSRAASRTIIINPTIPRISNMGKKLSLSSVKKLSAY